MRPQATPVERTDAREDRRPLVSHAGACENQVVAHALGSLAAVLGEARTVKPWGVPADDAMSARRERMRVTARCLMLLVLAGGAGCSLHKNAHIAPAADVDMDAKVLEKFQHEIEEYMEEHRDLVHRIPNVGPNATAEEIAAHRDKMTRAIQAERRNAKQGDIFKPEVEAAFRRIIARELTGPEREQVVQEIKQGNPKVESVPNQADPTKVHTEAVRVAVNATYNEEAPVSSMPPTLLLKLPQLPEQVRYRFVGRDLILRDTEANVILDFIKDAVTDRSVPR
jgi:hypothetical protein